MPKYKFREDKILLELKKYVDATYDKHYSEGKYQATEFIIDGGHGEGFCIGNVLNMHNDMERKMVRTEMTCLRSYIMV